MSIPSRSEMIARNIRLTVAELCQAVVDAEDESGQFEALEDLRSTLGAMCRELSGPMGAPIEGTRRRSVGELLDRDEPWLQRKERSYALLEGA